MKQKTADNDRGRRAGALIARMKKARGSRSWKSTPSSPSFPLEQAEDTIHALAGAPRVALRP